MGDVTLLVPVLSSLVRNYKDVDVTVVTRPGFAPLFSSIEKVQVFPADVDNVYAGFFGLRNLFRKLIARGNYDYVIDLHDHLRTKILRTFFRLLGYRVIVFDKGRADKKAFVRKENKVTTPLPHTVTRYAAAFEKAGYPITLSGAPYVQADEVTSHRLSEWLNNLNLRENEKWIGIAPFAAHTSKVWPLTNYPRLIEKFLEHGHFRFFLFGAGKKEEEFFESLRTRFPDHCIVVAGNLDLTAELALMQQLGLIITTDSANMHLATLAGTPLLSIWGGTHPDVGFGPLESGAESILQISRDELACRPCSVYGRETCLRGDFACLHRITADMIVDRALLII